MPDSRVILNCIGQTSDESPSARVKTATESDTLELESTSDGSGNREWYWQGL